METSLVEQLQKRIQKLEVAQASLKQELCHLILDDTSRPYLGYVHQKPPSISSSQLSRLAYSGAKGGRSTGVEEGTWCEMDSGASRHPSLLSRESRRYCDTSIPKSGDGNRPQMTMDFTQQQYLNILQSVGQAVYVFDSVGLMIYWNPSAEILFGYSVSEALGMNVLELVCDPDKDEARHVINRIILRETWSGTIPVKNKLGKQFAVFLTNSPLYDDQGNLLGIVGVAVDSQYFLQKTMPSPSLETYPSNRQPKVTSTKSRIHTQKRPQVVVSSKAMINKKRTGWPWKKSELDVSVKRTKQADEFDHQKSSDSIAEPEFMVMDENRSGDEPSGRRFSTTKASRKSSGGCTGGSTSSIGPAHKLFDIGADQLHYDIPWEDLTIDEQIGRGSCGRTVYHGFWCGSDVAVNVFSKFDYSDDLLHSFREEVLLMKKLRHPNVLLFMGAVDSQQKLCIVTEFLPRGSLFQLLKNTALNWRRRVLMALDIARGMNYLHQCDPPIIHRDLKSSSLLVDKNFTVKVGDFGQSRMKHATFLTAKSGSGTPQWMAPEVIRDEPSDEKSDVFNFGVILWELATQKTPWDSLTSFQVIGTAGYMDQRLEIPEVTDPHWVSLIESCWNREPKCRPTFKELLEKLKVIRKTYAVSKARRKQQSSSGSVRDNIRASTA